MNLLCWLKLPLILTIAAMFLPYRLMAIELKRLDSWKNFLHYQKAACKQEINRCRIRFLENCKKSELIPRFLRFRIPNKDSFDDKSVREFQRKLLAQELVKAKQHQKSVAKRVDEKRNAIKSSCTGKMLPSVALYIRKAMVESRKTQKNQHNKKLLALSEEQERPLFSVKNTVVTHELDTEPPSFVLETLSLGPKNAVLDRFEMYFLLHC